MEMADGRVSIPCTSAAYDAIVDSWLIQISEKFIAIL